jgi:hypothetical protein
MAGEFEGDSAHIIPVGNDVFKFARELSRSFRRDPVSLVEEAESLLETQSCRVEGRGGPSGCARAVEPGANRIETSIKARWIGRHGNVLPHQQVGQFCLRPESSESLVLGWTLSLKRFNLAAILNRKSFFLLKDPMRDRNCSRFV